MATRYSGALKITVTYVDATASYTARIATHEHATPEQAWPKLTELRLAPIHASLAVDSARAYDLAAEAALGFASYEHESIHVHACTLESGSFHVSRKAGDSWLAEVER